MDTSETKTEGEPIIDRAKGRIVGPGPYTLPLEFPFTATLKIEGGGTREETFSEFTIRRPIMKEISGAGSRAEKFGNSTSLYWLLAQLTGLPTEVVEQTDPADFAEAEAMIEVFTEKFQRTSKTSSAI